MPGEDRERVGDRVEHEIVALLGVVQERPSVLDVHGDAGVLVRAVGVVVATESVQQGIDLDGIDVPGAPRERDRDVVPTPRPDDQHVGQRVVRRMPVRLEPERLGRLHDVERHDPLVRPAVHADRHASVIRRRPRRDAVVGRPSGLRGERQDPEDDQRGSEHPHLRDAWSNHDHEDPGGDHAPDERRRLQEGEHGERGDPEDAPQDVPPIRLERFEAHEDTTDAFGDRGHDQEHEQEDDAEREPLGQGRPPEGADELQATCDAPSLDREDGEEQDERGEQEREPPEQIASRPGAEEPDPDAEEAREQHEIREEREVDDVGAAPSDQPELDEEHQEAQQEQPNDRRWVGG